MVQRRPTAAALDNNYQVDDHEPMYFLGMRVRHWARRVVMPIVSTATFIGIWAHSRPNDFQFDFFKSAPNTANVAALQKMSKLLFKVDYSYGSNGKLDKLARSDKKLDKSAAAAVMMAAYEKDTLTTQQIYEERANLKEFFEPAQDEAVHDLRESLDFYKLVKTRHYVTDGYGIRDIHPVTGEEGVMHHGVDLHFAPDEPVMYPEDLTFLGEEKKGSIKISIFEDAKKQQIELWHSAIDVDSTYTPGQNIPAMTVLSRVTDKDASSTGAHLHVQTKKWKKGRLVETDPTAVAHKIRKASLGMTNEYKEIPRFFAKRLKSADGYDFADMPNVIDSLEEKGKFKKKTANRLRKIYASYAEYVDKQTKANIWATVNDDRADMEMAFNAVYRPETNNLAGTKKKGKESYADLIRQSEIKVQTAAIVGLSLIESKKKLEAEDYSEYVVRASIPSKKTKLEFKAPKIAVERTVVEGWGEKFNRVPEDSLYKWMTEDPYMQEFAQEMERPIEDVAEVFMRLSYQESGYDPDIKAKDYKDKNGTWHKRSAGGLFGMVKKSRNGAASQIGLKWPDKSKLGTTKGIKTQISIVGQLATNVWDDLESEDQKYKSKHGTSLFDRVYLVPVNKSKEKAFKVESRFSAVINAWGPGVGGYVDLRRAEIKNAGKNQFQMPLFNNVVYASGQTQNFNKYMHYVPSTDKERAKEKKLELQWTRNKSAISEKADDVETVTDMSPSVDSVLNKAPAFHPN